MVQEGPIESSAINREPASVEAFLWAQTQAALVRYRRARAEAEAALQPIDPRERCGMKTTNTVLSIAAAVAGAFVVVAEVGYWLSHPYRSGPAAYIALCGFGVVLVAVAHLLRD